MTIFMNFITVLGVIFTILAGWVALRQYLHKQELEALGNYISSEEYLAKCYDNNNYNKWVKDNLAQRFTRILKINHIILNRLIELHENNLIDYNCLLKYYRYGNTQIRFVQSDHVSFIRDIQFLPFIKTSYRKEMFFLNCVLILGLLPIFISFFEFTSIILENKDVKFFDFFYFCILFLQGVIVFYVSVYFKRIARNANLFVTKLHEAEVEFLKIKNPKQVKKLNRNEIFGEPLS